MNTRKKESQNRLSHKFKSPEGLLLRFGSFLFLGLLGITDTGPNKPPNTSPKQGSLFSFAALVADDGTNCCTDSGSHGCFSSRIRGTTAKKHPCHYRHQ